jgi:hypothetical protein
VGVLTPAASPGSARRATRGKPFGFHPVGSGNPLGMSPYYRRGSNSVGNVIVIIADIMALILALWILMYLLDANRANDLVQFVHRSANWLAGWSRDLFTFDEAWARVICGYGLAAVVYLFIGHAIANKVHR